MPHSKLRRIAAWIVCAVVAVALAVSAGNAAAAGSKRPAAGKASSGKIVKKIRRADDNPPGNQSEIFELFSAGPFAHFGW